MVQNRKVIFRSLGRMDYQQAWDLQEQLLAEIVAVKTANRDLPDDQRKPTPNYLLFVEHPHVYTLGKSGSQDHLLLDETGLREKQAVFYKINRGGDITYHGPGQLVAYPIFDLENFFTDIHLYLRELEEAVIRTLAHYGIHGGRYPGYTGVWLDENDDAKARKICAMGVRCSRWVTMHGIALNVNARLDYFDHIVPCGIKDKAVTSMHRELGREVDMSEVQGILKAEMASVFGFSLIEG